ncbi:MAG: DUF262 domain-containing protein [Planctomycetota bacterium]|nr:DUF262 domain-containing protein [Planctomycetota bacterium]
MAAPSFLEEPQVAYLSRVLEDVKSGNILIPRFQRRFVWDDEDRIKLCESIRDGIPIGSLLVWRTSQFKLDTFPTIGGIAVPRRTDLADGTARQYLLDGHQRLATLFSALSGAPEAPSEAEEEFGLRAGDMFYDLRQQEFVIVDRGEQTRPELLPLSIVLDSIALLKYQRGLDAGHETDRLIGVADNLANRFRNYKIPIIPLVSDDLESATIAFQRINSSGRLMDDTHMVVALTYTKDFDLARELERVQSDLASVGWEEFDSKYILAAVRAKSGLEISTPNAERTSRVLRDTPEVIDEVVSAIKRTAQFLREDCCIPSPEFLPYSYQAVILSYAFLVCETPNGETRKALQNWLWTTAYTGFFRGARDSDIAKAKAAVERIVGGSRETGVLEPAGSVTSSCGKRFDFREARAKTLTIRLAERRIRENPDRREELLRLMADQGHKSLVRLIDRREYNNIATAFSENRLLLPSTALGELRRGLKQGLLHEDSSFSEHAITPEAAKAYRASRWPDFLRLRRAELERIEREFVEPFGLAYKETR